MPVSVKHAKTNAIADWTQSDLDNIIAGQPAPLPPSGTLISQITLPSDWNADHTISTSGASNGDVLTVVAGQAEWATPTSSGNVVGPASATDNAVVRFDLTTGKVIQNSGVIIDDSNNVSGIGTLAAGTTTLTSNAAQALAVGANGATNPAFQVNASAASAATGIGITAAAAGGGVVLEAISSGADEPLTIRSKGSSDLIVNATGPALRLQRGSTNQIILTSASATYANTQQHLFTTTSLSTAASIRFSYVSPTETNLTAGTEATNTFFNLAASRTHASNTAITLQRDFRIAGSTHAFANAGGTITDLAALALTPGTGGSNTTITNNSSLLVQAAAMANTTNGYGVNITAPTGATNNFAARFAGTAGEIFRLRTDGQVALLATNTAAGTTGAQTINRPSGTVNFAAGSSSLVVTNSLCTTASLVFATVRTNDATAVIKNVVPAAGSFTINLNAAATAETSVGFFIIN